MENPCRKPLYKLGDRFVRKGTRDRDHFEIQKIEYREDLEPEYELEGLKFKQVIRFGEEALTDLYWKLN